MSPSRQSVIASAAETAPVDLFAENRPRIMPLVGKDFETMLMAIADQRGSIFIFDFYRCRWFLAARTGVSVTSLAFSRLRPRELYAALADRTIHCYNIETSSLLAKLPPHHTVPPTRLSPHPTRPFLISQSPSEAVLWDTDRWTRVRVLSESEGAGGVVWAGYAPAPTPPEPSRPGIHTLGTTQPREERQLALALFANGSVMVWDVGGMDLLWKIELRENPRTLRARTDTPAPLQTTESDSAAWDADAPACIAVSRDLAVLVVGGRYRRGHNAPTTSLLVWSLPSRTLLHEIALPNLGAGGVADLRFVGATDVCVVLSGDGRCAFVDVVGAGYVGKVEGVERFHSVALSASGRFLAAISHPSHHLLSFMSTDGVMAQGTSRMLGPAFLRTIEDEAKEERQRWETGVRKREREAAVPLRAPRRPSPARDAAGKEKGWDGDVGGVGGAANVGLLGGDMGIPPPELQEDEQETCWADGQANVQEERVDEEPSMRTGAPPPMRAQTPPPLHAGGAKAPRSARPVSAPPRGVVRPARTQNIGPVLGSAPTSASIRAKPVSVAQPWRPAAKVPARGVRTERPLPMKPRPKKAPEREDSKVPGTLYELVEMTDKDRHLTSRRLLRFLRHYHAYPSKYRTLIWRFLLRLPENREAYATLVERGVHPVAENIRRRFPMKSVRNERAMIRLVSVFCHWSAIFENLDYFPGMIFPFIKAFGNDTFDCFESLMTIISNWCQNWWDYFPNPPFEYLDFIEDLLGMHDRELLAHFMRHRVTTQTYVWPLLKTFFSDVLYREEWLTVWDHILSNEIGWMQQWVVGYLRAGRGALMALEKASDFEYFFSHPTSVDIPRTIRYAYEQAETTPAQNAPGSYLNPFRPITRGASYPIFNKYPSFIVDYQKKLRDKIKQEEEEYSRRKNIADEVSRLGEELRRDKREWEAGDGRMSDALEEWWTGMVEEEEAHIDKLRKLGELQKVDRVRTMRDIAEARRVFLEQQAQNTAKHLSLLNRAVSSNRTRHAIELEDAHLHNRIQDIENEWLRRRDELMKAREELRRTDKLRMERLVRHSTVMRGDDALQM
ncbi:hypothetical protein M427DRAFT_211706 [Gonapodya prolifera JEL478]|uniref:Rab-GAP TBC domain-containing protein n=1 Tax=Gonapodya prolifera (strain JEL478) TaxID=1344416 RepID=A0A139AP24_GONPJ|nr:hypothetical protein M427DRAFT_211706 [Gonapodya prolifera JEL478]|eukprot:KXS18486.1 hypothetical protein M427DRAFT_211706 [Gonapodya prolifera JEL478]